MSKLITEPEKIRLQEESEVQAILGRPPGWLTRWGIVLVLIGVVLLLLMGSWLRYPDIVEAPARLMTKNPPSRLEAKVDGRIEAWEVSSGEEVEAGALLAVIQSPVDRHSAVEIQSKLAGLKQAVEERDIQDISLPGGLELGSLQKTYSELRMQLAAQQYLLKQNDKPRIIALTRQQIRELDQMNGVIRKEINTLKKELEVAQGKLERYKSRVPAVVSTLELEEAETTYLQTRRELESKERDLIANRLESSQLETRILELTRIENDEISRGWIDLAEAVQQMQSALDIWADQYLIEAPIAGRVILSRVWHENQFVNEGEVVLTIDPEAGSQEIIARAELPLLRSGKVNPGDSVLLRLEAYPYKEFGVVKGTVHAVAPIPESVESNLPPVYFAEIALTDAGLSTTTDSPAPVEFTQEMHATARIITEDRSFLGRVMDELTSIFDRN